MKNDHMPSKLSKSEAMATINREFGTPLSNGTTHFANINSSKSVWWIDIPVEKFTSGQYRSIDLLVFNSESKQLHHLQVQSKYVSDNLDKFRIRKDKAKACVSLELSSRESNQFQDVRPASGRMQFAQFLVKTTSFGISR
jgi:hypothetical protein